MLPKWTLLEMGHESLAVTQDYLADVRKPGEAKKAVADADSFRSEGRKDRNGRRLTSLKIT